MKKTLTFQPAQIGIIAVVLTSILLVIGIAVASRVTKDTAQNTQRTESGQALNTAESNLETAGNTSGDSNNPTTQVIGESSIRLSAGESVETSLPDVKGDINLYWQGTTNDATCLSKDNKKLNPALLLSVYCTTPENITSVDYFLYKGVNVSDLGEGYIASTAATDKPGYDSKIINIGNGTGVCAAGDTRTLRIKMLFCSSNLDMAGLVKTTRSISEDESGTQVRVIEQRETDPGAPSIMDFAVFSGSGNLEVVSQ